MSKQLRTLLVVVLAVAVLAGATVTLLLLPKPDDDSSSDSSDSSETDTSVTLIDKSKDSNGKTVEKPVKQAVLKTAAGEYTIGADADGQMCALLYQDLPVNTAMLDSLQSALATITATREVGKVTTDASSGTTVTVDTAASTGTSAGTSGGGTATTQKKATLGDYGFSKPLATVAVTYHDGSTASFELGSEEPLKSGYYFRRADDTTIYLVDSTLADTLQKPATAYIGTQMYAAPEVRTGDEAGQATVVQLDLTGSVRKDQPLTLLLLSQSAMKDSMSYTSYVTTKPYLRATNSSSLDSIMTAMTSLTASEAVVAHPTKEQLKKYGFQDPYSVAKIQLAVSTTKSSLEAANSSTTATTGTSTSTEDDPVVLYSRTTYSVTLGGKDADGNYYAMVNGIDVIYLVSASAPGWATLRYSNVVTTTMFLENIDNVQSITFTNEGKTTAFQLQHVTGVESNSDEALKVTAGGKQYETDNFRSLYQVLMGISRAGEATVKPTGTPALIIAIEPVDNAFQPIRASFYKTSSSEYTCVLADGDSYTLRASTMDHVIRQVQNFLNKKEVVTDW